MGNAPKKRWPLDVLVKRAEPALSRPELIRIAATSQSPTRAANEAEEKGYSKELIQACRWLAMIANDYPEYFSAVVVNHGDEQKMEIVSFSGPDIDVLVWPKKAYGDQLSLSQLQTMIHDMRKASELFDALDDTKFEIRKRKSRGISLTFVINPKIIWTRIIMKLGKEYIEIRSGRREGSVLREKNTIGLGAQTGEPRHSIKYEQPTLIVGLFPELPHDEQYNHRYTDRGLCWVYPGSPVTAHMELQNWDDPEISVEELVGFVELAKRRAEEVIEAVLNTK